MTREDEIQERLSKTEGSWRNCTNQDFPDEPGYEIYRAPADGGVYGTSGTVGWAGRVDEGEFIANAPEDIRYLLDKVASQERHIALLRSLALADEQKTAAGRFFAYTATDTHERQVEAKLEEKAALLEETLKKQKPTVVGSTVCPLNIIPPTQEEIESFFNND